MPPDVLPSSATIALLGFVLAFVFGAAAQRTHFCTMGAISDVINFGDWRRLRMWLLAIAVAMAATQALDLAGLITLGKSMYTAPNLIWLSHLVGGLLFGFGMTLASGCGSKTLIRLGAGNLKSLVVLVFLALSAYMTLRGLFGVFRVAALDSVSVTLPAGQDLPSLLGGAPAVQIGVTAVVVLACVIFAAVDRDFRQSPEHWLGALIIGAVIAAGWYVTGHLGHVAEHPQTLEEAWIGTNSGRPESFSFTAPVAYTFELLMLWSDKSKIVTFGIAGVVGMLVGSGAMAVLMRSFRWEGFGSVEDLANHVIGGVLMGFGGVTALGCTIGQGLTGIATLALGSIITLLAIVGGCFLALRYQYWRLENSV